MENRELCRTLGFLTGEKYIVRLIGQYCSCCSLCEKGPLCEASYCSQCKLLMCISCSSMAFFCKRCYTIEIFDNLPKDPIVFNAPVVFCEKRIGHVQQIQLIFSSGELLSLHLLSPFRLPKTKQKFHICRFLLLPTNCVTSWSYRNSKTQRRRLTLHVGNEGLYIANYLRFWQQKVLDDDDEAICNALSAFIEKKILCCVMSRN
jgi:hypothetical protein